MTKICVECWKKFKVDKKEERDICPACVEKKTKELWDWYDENR